ncbi:MAG: DUF456 domain-containing protein [Anaerolineae bacterium]|nr:DUF456 domain-containing protein [Anaerolineae bacterium]
MQGLGGDIVLGLTFVVMFIGLVGIVLPVLPGSILIFAAALFYALLDGFQTIGWVTLVVLGLLTAAATTASLWATSMGAKAGGASGWSILAGIVGGLVGLLFFSLPGSIVGALLGMFLVEVLRVKDWRKALKSGGGWLMGWLLSVIFELGIGLVMIAIFVWRVTLPR